MVVQLYICCLRSGHTNLECTLFRNAYTFCKNLLGRRNFYVQRWNKDPNFFGKKKHYIKLWAEHFLWFLVTFCHSLCSFCHFFVFLLRELNHQFISLLYLTKKMDIISNNRYNSNVPFVLPQIDAASDWFHFSQPIISSRNKISCNLARIRNRFDHTDTHINTHRAIISANGRKLVSERS